MIVRHMKVSHSLLYYDVSKFNGQSVKSATRESSGNKYYKIQASYTDEALVK